MKEILEFLSQTYRKLTREVMTYVLQNCDERVVSKGEVLLEQGKVCRHVWFIKKGVLAAHQEDLQNPEKKSINWFMQEGDIATSVISFFDEEPSNEKVVAVEASVVFQMSRKDLFAGIEAYQVLAILTLLVVIRYYVDTRFNEACFRMKNYHLIYERLLARCPELVQRVLERDMALFLGVSEPVFRDIKSGKYKKKKEDGVRAEKPKPKKK